MELLDYLRLAQQNASVEIPISEKELRIAIVTNFTDDLLAKSLHGQCISDGIYTAIYQVPFRQYLFEFKNPSSNLIAHKADITFIFFDVNPYLVSEFSADSQHVDDVCDDIERLCSASAGTVVVHTLAMPTTVQHGRLFREHRLSTYVRIYNERIIKIADAHDNVFIIDTDQFVRAIGERRLRDMRGLYAFGQPFSNDFLFSISKEWMAYVRSLTGRSRKCIVVDLDNTLWGGVVGEVGPLGIELGPVYPGNAYQEFQRVLLDYYDRGIILAINSRNNPEDVREVFEKNPNMILKEKHFAALAINWKNKAENLVALARELNIGLEALVFIDDDPVNRDLVRSQLPQVQVPEFSMPPEEYARMLLELDAFHTLRLTDEDRERGAMYAQERERREVLASVPDMNAYIETLGIEIDVSLNAPDHIARIAQLTQKTNQFNLTTRRMTEDELAQSIIKGALVFSGMVRDKFGSYGVTISAILNPTNDTTVSLDVFLMSCRVMGRGVEQAFFRAVANVLREKGFEDIVALFIPTKKNAPAADFLRSLHAKEIRKNEDESEHFEIHIDSCLLEAAQTPLPIAVNVLL